MNAPPDTRPSPLATWVERWHLQPDGDAFSTASSHLMPVRHHGTAAVLKVARTDEERRGNVLMAWWQGTRTAQHVARVLEHEGAAVVLERAEGPRSLTSLASAGAGSHTWSQSDARASRVLCAVAADLHDVGPAQGTTAGTTAGTSTVGRPALVPLDRWFRDLLTLGETHRGFVHRAATTARALLDERRDETVLHGDLHHGNVLDFGDERAPGWKAIDPKGLVGDRAFDYVNVLCNPSHDVALLPGRLERQVSVVAAASGLDEQRLLRWLVAWTGLSGVWFQAAGPGWMSSASRDVSAAGALAVGRLAEDLLR